MEYFKKIAKYSFISSNIVSSLAMNNKRNINFRTIKNDNNNKITLENCYFVGKNLQKIENKVVIDKLNNDIKTPLKNNNFPYFHLLFKYNDGYEENYIIDIKEINELNISSLVTILDNHLNEIKNKHEKKFKKKFEEEYGIKYDEKYYKKYLDNYLKKHLGRHVENIRNEKFNIYCRFCNNHGEKDINIKKSFFSGLWNTTLIDIKKLNCFKYENIMSSFNMTTAKSIFLPENLNNIINFNEININNNLFANELYYFVKKYNISIDEVCKYFYNFSKGEINSKTINDKTINDFEEYLLKNKKIKQL